MKLTIKEGRLNYRRCIKCVAVIYPSKKLGILKRRQKTWRIMTVAPEFTLKEQSHILEKEAKRWEQTILNPVIRKLQVQEGLL